MQVYEATGWVKVMIFRKSNANVDENIDLNAMVIAMKKQGILFSAGKPLRLVTHLDVTKQDIDSFISALSAEI